MDIHEMQRQKVLEATKKYSNLELKEFIKNVLLESGYDIKIMDNVYIGEYVEAPDVWGCFKKDGKYITYYGTERAYMSHSVYEDPYKFMRQFIINSMSNRKY